MPSLSTEVATESASRYLQQLCKHWSHKAEAAFDANAGSVRFESGNAVSLTATGTTLSMTVTSADAGAAATFAQVVEDHIKRFAFREELSFAWASAE